MERTPKKVNFSTFLEKAVIEPPTYNGYQDKGGNVQHISVENGQKENRNYYKYNPAGNKDTNNWNNHIY